MISQTETIDYTKIDYKLKIRSVRRKIANHPDIRCDESERINKFLDSTIKLLDKKHANS